MIFEYILHIGLRTLPKTVSAPKGVWHRSRCNYAPSIATEQALSPPNIGKTDRIQKKYHPSVAVEHGLDRVITYSFISSSLVSDSNVSQ